MSIYFIILILNDLVERKIIKSFRVTNYGIYIIIKK